MIKNTPPMGWNSWNTFGHEISDQLIRDTADQAGRDRSGRLRL